jgi:hypothetical protein
MKPVLKKYSVDDDSFDENSDEIINLKNICSRKVKLLSKDECIELLRIIHKNNIQNSINNNGTFVNLTNLDYNSFKLINDYVNNCYDKKEEKKEIDNDLSSNFDYYFNDNELNNNDFYDKFNEIKNSKKLNSLEKSVVRGNITKAIVDTQEDEKEHNERLFKIKEENSGKKFFMKKKSSKQSKKQSNK